MVIIMLGAPGTGKGTVANILSEELGIVHISSGEIFRSYVKNQKEIGSQIEKYIAKQPFFYYTYSDERKAGKR